MADQLAAQALPAYGHRVVQAPHITALAERGARFESAYCASPLCAPSRFALMTGRLPSRTGAYDNAAEQPAAIPTIAHGLRTLGYRTCLAGKMHFIGPDQLHGYEERLTTDIYPADFGWTPNWDAPEERIDWWYHNMASVKEAGVAEATNQLDFDDEAGAAALRYLRDMARTDDPRPFFLTVSFTHPHDPYVIRQDYWDRYAEDAIDRPTVPPIAYDDLDSHSRRLWHAAAMGEVTITADDTLRARRAHYGAISYIDDWLGRILETLRRLDLADDTIVVFSADHGDLLGERGLWYKMHFFERAARVPLIIARPGRPAARIAEPVGMVDLLPTLLDLAGGLDGSFAQGFESDGTSLLPLLDGGHRAGRPVLGEYLAEAAVAPVLMVRRGSLKLIWCEADPPLLFDLAGDPHELHNLATECPDLAEPLIAELHRRWDVADLKARVLASQRARRLAWGALTQGRPTPWDFQPHTDASRQYMRNDLDLNEVDRGRRYPRPGTPG
jgi:choline-sulfatase